MAVLIEALSVIVPREVLQLRFPGGEEAYIRQCPNGTFCADPHLTRVGFMTPSDVGRFCDDLEAANLKPLDNLDRFLDLAVVDQMTGPTRPCPWLDAARHFSGFSFAWKRGTEPGRLSVPPGWTVDQSKSMSLHLPEQLDNLLPLQAEGAVEVWLDLQTGKEKYLGSPYKGRNKFDG